MARADLDKDPADVAAMFDDVAERYDLTNDVLALGQTRRWRRLVVEAVDPRPGDRVLDLAAGTGTSSAAIARTGAYVVPADFSLGMLRVGKRRQPDLPFVAGDGLHLPFADGVFDAATISFGLRNLADRCAGLRELARVVRPGGRPAVARRTSSNPEAYVYLAESIRAWPDQRALAADIAASGWSQVQWRDLTGGIVALHRARRAA